MLPSAKAVYFTPHNHEITPLLVVGVLYMFQLIVPVQEDVLLVTNMRAYSLPYRPRGGYNYLIWPVFLGWVYLGWAWLDSRLAAKTIPTSADGSKFRVVSISVS